MQKQTVSFSRTLLCLALVGFLMFSANSAVGQIFVNGSSVNIWNHHYLYHNNCISSSNSWENHVCRTGLCGPCSAHYERDIDGSCYDTGAYESSLTLMQGTFINNSRYTGEVRSVVVSGHWYYDRHGTYHGYTLDNYGTIDNATVGGWREGSNGPSIINRGHIITAYVNEGGNMGNAGTITSLYADGGNSGNAGVSNYGGIGRMYAQNNTWLHNSGTITRLAFADTSWGESNGNADIYDVLASGTGSFINRDNANITMLNIYDSRMVLNNDNATILQATVNDNAWIRNGGRSPNTEEGTASIVALIVRDNGMVDNSSTAEIGEAVVHDYGVLSNGGSIGRVFVTGDALVANSSGEIGEAFINANGSVVNEYGASIGTLTIFENGHVSNERYATINNVTQNGGTLINDQSFFGNTINDATVNGGQFDNKDWGLVENLTLNGGTVNNTGTINNLTYTSGRYNGQFADDWWVHSGSIGTLTLAGDATGIDWGTVDNLVFHSNGNGILHLTAFELAPVGFASYAASTEPSMNTIGFSGITAQHIDLTNGRVVLDFSTLGAYEENLLDTLFANNMINLSELFGADVVTGVEMLGSFEIDFGTNSFFVYNNGAFTGDWGFIGYNAIPEPTTLAILGLGLAGLGYARRRMKK